MSDHRQGVSRLLAFFDECGDHSMDHIDPDFPLFVLSTVIVEREAYARAIVPAMAGLKLRYWDHEGINLHSRDIRKKYRPFDILEAADVRERFMADLTAMMGDLPYTLFLVVIDKRLHRQRYGSGAWHPYEFALALAFERILFFMEQENEVHLPVIAEARGQNEDQALEAAFYRIMSKGTAYIGPERFRKLVCPILFQKKRKNICGLQLADLCAYPAARTVLNPRQPNRAFEVVRRKIYNAGGNGVTGWKVFP